MKIPIFSALKKYVVLFYQYTGNTIYFFVSIIFVTGFIDSLGLSVAIPLINHTVSEGNPNDRVSVLFNKFFSLLNLSPSLLAIILLMVALFSLKSIFLYVQGVYQATIVSNLYEKIRNDLIMKFCSIKYSYFSKINMGHLNNIVSVESNRFASALKHMCMFFSLAINGMIYYVFAVLINFKFSIIIGSVGILIYVVFHNKRNQISLFSKQYTKYNKKSQSLSIQFILNYKYLKATSQTNKLRNKLSELFKGTRIVTIEGAKLKTFTNVTTQLITIMLVLFSFYYLLEIDNQKFAEIAVPLIFVNRAFSAIYAMQNRWQSFLELVGSIHDVDKTSKYLLNQFEEISGEQKENIENGISFENVSFGYDKKLILKNISIEIKKNTTVGIAGKSGSGKTTLLDLLNGLLIPTSGKICIDGINYEKYNKTSLRNNFGYITQEPAIFNDTIGNNISFWDYNTSSDYKMDRLKNAAEAGYCTEFINNEENTYNKVIGDRGITLSGGQRQRLCIAREIFRDRDILIFDEATAALDSHSERLIQESIKEFLGKKTIVIVAHRLSTLRYCDKIIVMDAGKIVEQGTWKTLLQNSTGVFAAMVKEQEKV